MSKSKENVMNFDRILVEEVGQWGKYQLMAVLLCALEAVLGGLSAYAYLFAFDKSKTRCAIPECENSSTPLTFAPSWILDAVPSSGDSFDNCHRYPSISTMLQNTSGSCPATFDRNSSMACEEYVYEHNYSAYYEFNLACDSWRPTLVGSANVFGMMICLPLTGFVADRWGRRIAFSLSSFNSALFGSLIYFTGSYNSYISLSFVGNLLGASCFSSAYILAVEYVGPKYRVVTGITMSTCLSIGEALLGPLASAELYWRHLLLAIYIPQLAITVFYFWIAPESVRWLMSKGRHDESLKILKKAAAMNGNALSEETTKGFAEVQHIETKENDNSEPWLVCLVFRHKPILLRCMLTPVWWITSIMLYYGLTISSVGISGNKYLNYSASTVVQIPGYWIAMLLLNRIGRKALLITGFWISGACQFAYIFISDGHYWLSLLVYLLGKMCISGVMTSLYVYTAELFPTRYRTSLFAYSSMMGRIGGILAPLMPGLAAEVWVHLPFALFGSLAFLSGALMLIAPETLGITLPDTMEEASRIDEDSSGILKCLKTVVRRSKSYTIK